MPRVLLIGLDCVPPRLAFQRYLHAMPNLARLMATGTYGALRSSLPPITVPAWACMLSGFDPGELGLYGFRNRAPGRSELRLASSHDLARPMLWDRLSAIGARVCLLCVPPSYPPQPVNGELVSCFLTPDADCEHTYPRELAAELRAKLGPYQPDVDDYRSDDLRRLLKAIYALSAQRFAMAEHMLRTRRPDFTAVVDIGPDRFHHAFWSHIDPEHPQHVPGNVYAREGERYYAFLDEQIGRLLMAAGQDTTALVVSDHGARPLLGAICVNEWLIEHGYLVLDHYPTTITPFSELAVNWRRTRAWGEGGYYARIAFNVSGREVHGCVRPEDIGALAQRLTEELGALPGPHGEKLAHRIVTPANVYRETRGSPPDLMVFFDDLSYRALGSVGHRGVYSAQNDTGADGCNHDWDGIFVLAGGGATPLGQMHGLRAADVTKTILGVFGVRADDVDGTDRSRRSALVHGALD